MTPRAPYYRIVFWVAAGWNVAFGVWTVFWPQSFFLLFRLAPPLYPQTWQAMGMVVGLYGLLYGYAALRPDRARPIILIGLLGKVLGPIGWLLAVGGGEWPVQTFPLIVFNDLVWWVPFSLFLLEGSSLGARLRAAAPMVCGALNGLAALALLFWLREGTEVVADLALRQAYIVEHAALWRAGWALWMGAAISYLCFIAWWARRVGSGRWGIIAFAVVAAGVVFDVTAESLFIGWLPWDMASVQRAGTLLTGGAANLLYTVGGVILTLRTKALRGPLRVWAWAIWALGFGLTAAALAGNVLGMVATSAALMALFVPWVVVVGRRLA